MARAAARLLGPLGLTRERLDTLWIAYGERPPGPPPRRWRGLTGYGRLDIAARVLLAALYPRGRLEEDSGLLVYLGSERPAALSLLPSCLPGEMEYEHESAELLLRVLRGEACRLLDPAPPLVELLRALRARGYRVVLLTERGGRLRRHRRGTAYVLGLRVDPPRGLPVDEEASVGPCSYLASHVTAYVNALRLLGGARA
ncbi:hypothetical protein CF15_05285 [Pyrodictium occultum]|uniref:Uncharacterized protein n=1 Tax=Pyrodictium occultum TaxID=2309 RepID=A0A0V8RVU6_PYROC|nr:hypothetical protein [Pyrodictium occultum]KSW12175.1 hypothetical protein CF15_05285 [Pyrodictium occultum]